MAQPAMENGGAISSARVPPVTRKSGHLAVRVGFEPTEPVKVQRFSRPPDSTTLAPHRIFILPDCAKSHSTLDPSDHPSGTLRI